jgi:histidinol-phosphate aminotransferase
MKPLVTANIEKLRPYLPGKPIEETERQYGVKNPAKLASNENPLGASRLAIEAMRSVCNEMHLYPDGGCYTLKLRLAQHLSHYDVEPHNLIIGNGSSEIIDFLIRTFVGADENVVTGDPSFIMYRLACIAHNCEEISVPLHPDMTYNLDAIAKAVTRKTKVVFLASPNNPTGRAISTDDLEHFLARVRDDVIICLDEAYAEYIDDKDVADGLRYAPLRHRLVVLRTFAKIYGLAGLRVGYGVSSQELVSYMDRVRGPFNVSRIAQVAATAALDDSEHVSKTRELNISGRRFLEEAFTQAGLKWYPSQANFILVDFEQNAAPIYEALLYKGFITRPVANYGLPNCLRISTGTQEQNQGLARALAEVMNEIGSAQA